MVMDCQPLLKRPKDGLPLTMVMLVSASILDGDA
jgi:hypothetical protein